MPSSTCQCIEDGTSSSPGRPCRIHSRMMSTDLARERQMRQQSQAVGTLRSVPIRLESRSVAAGGRHDVSCRENDFMPNRLALAIRTEFGLWLADGPCYQATGRARNRSAHNMPWPTALAAKQVRAHGSMKTGSVGWVGRQGGGRSGGGIRSTRTLPVAGILARRCRKRVDAGWRARGSCACPTARPSSRSTPMPAHTPPATADRTTPCAVWSTL